MCMGKSISKSHFKWIKYIWALTFLMICSQVVRAILMDLSTTGTRSSWTALSTAALTNCFSWGLACNTPILNVLKKETATVKPVLSGHSKIDKTKVFMANGSLMRVERIAECFPWWILQYFWPALSDKQLENQFWSSFWVTAYCTCKCMVHTSMIM